MTLTEADVSRLEAAGHRGFTGVTATGDLQLRNAGGRCVFLVDGRCTVYRDRPEGCRLYPFVLDLDADRVVRDDHCPWSEEFVGGPLVEASLRASVAREAEEARRRLRRSEARQS
jgi:Fe-S-cluster containining protein